MSNEIKPVCVLQGPVASRSGYGDHAFQIATALIQWDKFDVKIAPTRWGGCPNTMLDDETRPWVKEIKSRILTTPLQSQPEMFVQVSIPNEFQPIGKFNVGITAGIETTVPRVEWIEGLNRMNVNIVPSKFSKDVFEAAAFTKKHQNGQEEHIKMVKPMFVAFEGIDMDIYKKGGPTDQAINSTFDGIDEDFVFLFVGHWLSGGLGADRKDVGMLIKVFSEVFKDKKKKPALVLKTSGASFSNVDKHDILKKIHNIRKDIKGDLPNVYIIHGDLTQVQLNALYNHPKVKAHVSFTHGEGFGRPLLEASVSGKPVIASEWSGQLDFLPKDLAVLLPGTVSPIPESAVNEWLIKESAWFNVNYSVAAQKLDDVFNNYKNYTKNADTLGKINSEKFTLDGGNKVLIEILKSVVPVFETKVGFQLPKFKKIEAPISRSVS